jgi:uncharacterized membrane protein YbaN (DUF454 family)
MARARGQVSRRPFPRFGLATRVALVIVGWVLVVLGVIGWFLPILQGWLTLFMGLAVLSLTSQRLHGFLRERFRRWPRGWRRLEKFRRRVTRWLHRRRATPPS